MKVAVIQMAPAKSNPAANRARLLECLNATADEGALLTVFPECAVSGYSSETREDALQQAEPMDGPTFRAVHALCARRNVWAIYGNLEKAKDDRMFNSAIAVGPQGLCGVHRKAHIAPTGADAFVDHGEALNVFHVAGIRVGLLICYEIRFPEAARVMALKGAQALVVCANWPAGAEVNPTIMAPARAAENSMHVIAANRGGGEGPFNFIGRSRVLDPQGTVITEAIDQRETVLYAEIDIGGGLTPREVSASHYVVDLRGHRRPGLYAELSDARLLRQPL